MNGIDPDWEIRLIPYRPDPAKDADWSKHQQVVLWKRIGHTEGPEFPSGMAYHEYRITDPVLRERYGKMAAQHLAKYNRSFRLMFDR